MAAVGIALAAFIGLAIIAFASWCCWRFYVVLKELRDQIRVMNSSLTGVPALLEGIKAICRDLSVNTVNLNGSVNVLKKSLIDETSDSRRPGVAQYDDEAADRAYMQQIIAQNEALAGEESNRFIVSE